MRNEKLINLRLKNNLTQEELSDKLYSTATKIRNWEHGKALPTIEDMEMLAKIFNVEVDTILSIFNPYHTNSQHDNSYNTDPHCTNSYSDLSNENLGLRKVILVTQFKECNSIKSFFEFIDLISINCSSGIICYCDYIFHFSKIVTEQENNIVIFADASDNYFIFNDTNIQKVKPISPNFDVYTFEISTDYPMFPTGMQSLPADFEQKIRISIFDCWMEIKTWKMKKI